MPPPLQPNTQRWQQAMERRVGNLERRQSDAPAAARRQGEIIFSQALLSVDESGRYYPPIPCRLVGVVATLATAGSSTTTVQVAVNGGVQGTVSLVSGDHFQAIPMANGLAADVDYVTVETTAVGAGAAGLVVSVRFVGRVA